MTTTWYQDHVNRRFTRSVTGGPRPVPRRVTTHTWTAADTEAAEFVSGCIAAGALLGLLAAGVRPARAERHG
jgi:hypothetical protein